MSNFYCNGTFAKSKSNDYLYIYNQTSCGIYACVENMQFIPGGEITFNESKEARNIS